MKRVLIISPHFPPTNAADMQRVRMIAPYLEEAGWEAEILAVEANQVASPQDQFLVSLVPVKLPIHRVKALGLGWSRIPGLGSLSLRAVGALKQKGNRLLQAKHFDLIYFSTTQFTIHKLGPYWRQKFDVPFVMDYQDPWVNDYYHNHPEVTPPGGRLKYAVADRLNRWLEPRVLKYCSGITSVSPDYPKQLYDRYSFLPSSLLVKVIPFPGEIRDFDQVISKKIKQSIYDTEDGFLHWVYVGRGGKDIAKSVNSLFKAISTSELKDRIRLHFIGTSYAAKGLGIPTILKLAYEAGVSNIVEEVTYRIPYSQALACLLNADALIVPGSNDPGYTASKIYPYLLASKPLLAIFHESSSIVSLLHEVGGGVCVEFNDKTSEEDVADKIREEWFVKDQYLQSLPLDKLAFESFTARSQSREVGEWFNIVMKHHLDNL